MKYLIDTQALSYFLYDEKRLPEQIIDFIEDFENKGYVSVVSLHEIVVKNAKGQIIVPEPIIKVVFHTLEKQTLKSFLSMFIISSVWRRWRERLSIRTLSTAC